MLIIEQNVRNIEICLKMIINKIYHMLIKENINKAGVIK
jgi:hypothetical protein